ncbi:MAG: hypothetical protein OK422_01210 [Thaumarchaeota archaeon]|nr:hypothetical protein [Nitrososphaerota archaeon]
MAKTAVSTAAAIIVVVVIVVAAAAAYVFVLSPSGTSSGSSSSSSHSASSSSTSRAASSTSSSSTSTQTSTSTSSSSSTSSQSTTSTASTYSCTSTFASTTGTPKDYTPQYINLVAKFSSITFKVSGVTNGTTSQNSTISYHTTTVSSGIYDVNITFATNSGTQSGIARVDSNNESVISVTFSSYTFYGAQAKSFFDSFMGLFGLEYSYGAYLGVLTSSNYFHSTGTASMTYGSATFAVTTWVANSLPLSVNECGYTATITAFTLEVGTPTGTSLTFITYLHFASSAPQNADFTFQLVSMTAA